MNAGKIFVVTVFLRVLFFMNDICEMKLFECQFSSCIFAAWYFRSVADFPKFLGIAIETFLTLCDDTESDIRIVADECLNRSIKVTFTLCLAIKCSYFFTTNCSFPL